MGERQRLIRPEEMASTSTAVATVPAQIQEEPVERVAVITLRQTAARPATRKKVVWTEDTVDNEHMNKKKSKCCCIYEKPKKFDESDSEESDDECEHCFGHVEKKHGKHHHHQHTEGCALHGGGGGTLTINEEATPAHEPTAVITLQPSDAVALPAPAHTAMIALQPSDSAPIRAPAPPDKTK